MPFIGGVFADEVVPLKPSDGALCAAGADFADAERGGVFLAAFMAVGAAVVCAGYVLHDGFFQRF